MLDSTQITYIKSLQKASKENRLVIFAGAGTSADAGIPLWGKLITELSEVLPENVRDNYKGDNLQLAELFREVSDDKDYYDKIESVLLNRATSPNSIHNTILSLHPCHIITTNYDTLFEEAALKNNRQYFVVATDSDLPRNHGEKLIVKMHGDLKHHNIILTENDYYDYARKFPLIRSFVISQFVSKVVLFIGFSFNDPNLKFIMREIRSELGSNMQHVYLLTDTSISKIESYHQFNRGINVLSIVKEEASQELGRLKASICRDFNLKEKGLTLVNQLSIIQNYKTHTDIVGMAIEFAKENLQEVKSLGYSWRCMLPQGKRAGFSREGINMFLPRNYQLELEDILSSKEGVRKLIRSYGKDLGKLRAALVRDDVNSIDHILIDTESYRAKCKRNRVYDGVDALYNLNQIKLSTRISLLRGQSLTYTIKDLELPYILFHSGHFYEAYKLYKDLAPQMWLCKRYALFFICIYNMHSVSLPAINSQESVQGSNTSFIREQYYNMNLNEELAQLPLPEGVNEMFADLINRKQLNSNLIKINDFLQQIETQRKGAEKGTLRSYNSNIENVIWNFITFLDFLNTNYLIIDNNFNGQFYYDSVTRCIVNSNLIPSDPPQSKLKELFKEVLIIMIHKTPTDRLKKILKDVGKERKLTADAAFKNKIGEYIENLYSIKSDKEGIITDLMLEQFFKNIILVCNSIKDCPKYEHLDELIAKYWTRLRLNSFIAEICTLFESNQPDAKIAGSILSLLAKSRRHDINFNYLAQILVKAILKGNMTWDYLNYMGAIENQNNTDFAAIVTSVLTDDMKIIVIDWMKSHFKSLCEIASAETICNLHILNQETFDKYKGKPYVSSDFQGECNLALHLKELYRSPDYSDLKSRIEEYANINLCFRFILNPTKFTAYNDQKFKGEWFEWLNDDDILLLTNKKEVLSAMKQYADNSRWGNIFKQRLSKLLWGKDYNSKIETV